MRPAPLYPQCCVPAASARQALWTPVPLPAQVIRPDGPSSHSQSLHPPPERRSRSGLALSIRKGSAPASPPPEKPRCHFVFPRLLSVMRKLTLPQQYCSVSTSHAMTNAQMFRHQSHQFAQMVRATNWIGDAYGKDRPSPTRVLAFVEALLLSPTERAAQVHIAQDQASAELCRGIAGDMGRAFDIESALAGVERPMHETPFYLLASLLLKRAQLSVEQFSDDWKPKP